MGSIQIKNAPDDLHDRIRSRARERSMTVRDYLVDLVERDLEKPTLESWLAQVREREPVDLPDGLIAEVVREGREERGAALPHRHPR